MHHVIASERPDTADAQTLIGELDAVLTPLYSAESRHGYSVEKLIREGVHFFVLRLDGVPATCGGIQFYAGHGEIKRMFSSAAYRGRGLGYAMLTHLEAYARDQGCLLLRLETGIHQPEAIHLYERSGFARIEAFPPYTPDPVSLFFEKRLTAR